MYVTDADVISLPTSSCSFAYVPMGAMCICGGQTVDMSGRVLIRNKIPIPSRDTQSHSQNPHIVLMLSTVFGIRGGTKLPLLSSDRSSTKLAPMVSSERVHRCTLNLNVRRRFINVANTVLSGCDIKNFSATG